MKKVTFIIMAFVLFSACKTPQNTTFTIKENQETEVKNDVRTSDEKLVAEITNQVINRLTDEKTEINLKSTEYDTEKPVDPSTGKPPIKKESDLKVNNQKKVDEKETIETKKDSVSQITSSDNSQIKEKTVIDTKEVAKAGLKTWQKVLMAVGCLTLIGLIIFLIIKFK